MHIDQRYRIFLGVEIVPQKIVRKNCKWRIQLRAETVVGHRNWSQVVVIGAGNVDINKRPRRVPRRIRDRVLERRQPREISLGSKSVRAVAVVDDRAADFVAHGRDAQDVALGIEIVPQKIVRRKRDRRTGVGGKEVIQGEGSVVDLDYGFEADIDERGGPGAPVRVSIAVLDSVVDLGRAHETVKGRERVSVVAVIDNRAAPERLHISDRYFIKISVEIVPQKIVRQKRDRRIQIRAETEVGHRDWCRVQASTGNANIDKYDAR